MKARSASGRVLRIFAVVGVVAATSFLASPLDAHHSVEFTDYDCEAPTPSPDTEPDLTAPPSAEPSGPPTGEATPPPQNCMPLEGERVWGTRVIVFSSDTDPTRPIKTVALRIQSDEEGIPHANNNQPLLLENYSRANGVERYGDCDAGDEDCRGGPFSWDSRVVTPLNGRYKLRVDVDTYPFGTGNTPHNAAAERIDLRVDNPPLKLAAPTVVAKTASGITVQWPAATESDITAYTLYRAVTKTNAKPDPSALKQIAIPTGTSYRDTDIEPGFHWYAVKVTRRSIVTPETGISSPLSDLSAVAQIAAPASEPAGGSGGGVTRPIPDLRKPQLVPRSHSASIPDAPFTYQLPVGDAPPGSKAGSFGGTQSEPGDPRGAVLPVAVGMFLVSSALAVGRMPYGGRAA